MVSHDHNSGENSVAGLQSLVEGEINVAQAAAFMVLLHAKVHTLSHSQQL